MTTWIERIVQHAHTRSQRLGWSPNTKLEQPPADGPRYLVQDLFRASSLDGASPAVEDIWTPPFLGARVARNQTGLEICSFDSPLVPSAVQATWPR